MWWKTLLIRLAPLAQMAHFLFPYASQRRAFFSSSATSLATHEKIMSGGRLVSAWFSLNWVSRARSLGRSHSPFCFHSLTLALNATGRSMHDITFYERRARTLSLHFFTFFLCCLFVPFSQTSFWFISALASPNASHYSFLRSHTSEPCKSRSVFRENDAAEHNKRFYSASVT